MTSTALLSSVDADLALPDPLPSLQCCVIVPVKNEEDSIRRLMNALMHQVELDDTPMKRDKYEVILLLNNCSDQTADVLREFQSHYPSLILHSLEVTFPKATAHVGRARQLLFDLAANRFSELDRPAGLILTTDADTVPSADWIAQTEREIACGVDGVGGRITICPGELQQLPAHVKRWFLYDIGYRRALEEMRSLYAPDAHDPFPRHHQHFGASLAVTMSAYRAAGGMPLCRSSEDVALYRAVLASGGKFRHSYKVQATTSARFMGRATGGLADAFHWWGDQKDVYCESALAAETRLATLGVWRMRFPLSTPPWDLYVPPESPSCEQREPIEVALNRLRERNVALREMPLEKRLMNAMEKLEIVMP